MTTSVIEYAEGVDIVTRKIKDYDECDTNKICNKSLIKLYSMSLNNDSKVEGIFDYILKQIMEITESKVGGICEKVVDNKDEYLTFVSTSFDCTHKNKKFHSAELGNLLGRSMQFCHIVLSNNVPTDPRSKGIHTDHFPLIRFLGIPLVINEMCIGQIILANSSAVYTEEHIYNIYSLIKVCCDTLFHSHYKKKYVLSDVLHSNSDVKSAKDNFMATISHEIRTPLTGIMGTITLLPDAGPLNDKQKEYIKIATTCSIQLLDLINSILDFSRLKSNTLTLVNEQMSINDCISQSIEIVQTSAHAKNIEIILDMGQKHLPIFIIGDQKRMRQILINLLSNAIKFSQRDTKIYLTLESVKIDEHWNITFSVKDTGIGIIEQDQNKIFTAFSQLKDIHAYNKQDGAGLGLAISKELVELMGGTIKVESDGKNKGCTFSFNIIVEEFINVEEFLKLNSDLLRDVEVLNIDDKMDNLLILEDMLFVWGLTSTMCNTAQQALRYLEHGKKIDIAIVDIYMPFMSGIELAQKLRSLYPHISIIGISSVGKEIQGKEWFDIYLSKPYNASEILKSIIYCLKNRNERGESKMVLGAEMTIGRRTSVYRKRSIQKVITKEDLKILLAEDDKNTQFIFREMIEQLGYKNLKIVDNGKDCVEEAKREKYNIILMDIKMPIMDGFEASKYIKLNAVHPPIIAVSAGVLDSDKNMYMKAGMDGYLGKPFNLKELDAILKQFLK